MAPGVSEIAALPEIAASDVKKRGWRGVMRTLQAGGAVLVTNHAQPEAVIMGAREYQAMLELVKHAKSREAAELDALRARFDERLAALRVPDAGGRLRSVMRHPARLRGKVKAGAGS